MIFTNHLSELTILNKKSLQIFLQLLNPFAPHLTEELNEKVLKNLNKPITSMKWPNYDPKVLESDIITIAVQLNGKMRGTIVANSDEKEEVLIQIIKSDKKLKKFLEDKELLKTIVIPNKLVNLVLK